MNTLRDAIETRIDELTQSSGPTVFTFDNPGDAADDIISLIRERLLSDDVIRATSIAVLDEESAECWKCVNDMNEVTREAITAALKAVTGEQP